MKLTISTTYDIINSYRQKRKKKDLASREMLSFLKERSQAYAELRVDVPWSSVSSRDLDQGSSVQRG